MNDAAASTPAPAEAATAAAGPQAPPPVPPPTTPGDAPSVLVASPSSPSPSLPSSAAEPALPFRPIVAPLIRHRASAAAIGLASAAQVLLTALHFPGIECPFLRLTGVPCPGCGLSRACAAMVTGSPDHSLRMHAFATPVLIGVTILLVAAFLPAAARAKMGDAAERVERGTGLTFLLLVALLLYWLGRLLYAPQAFISLVGHR